MSRRSRLPFVVTHLPLVVAAIALYYFAPNEIGYIDVILGLYALAFVAAIFWGRRSSVIVWPNVEAENDGSRRFGKQNVALGDSTHAAVNDLDLHFGIR